MKKSALELKFKQIWGKYFPHIPYKEEAQIVPGRKFRHDFIFPDSKVAVEIQGATFVKGAHSTGVGIQRDYEKNLLSAKEGYVTIFLTRKMICLECLTQVHDVINIRSGLNEVF